MLLAAKGLDPVLGLALVALSLAGTALGQDSETADTAVALEEQAVEIVERIDEQPSPAEAVRRIPPASRHAVEIAPMRRAAAWLGDTVDGLRCQLENRFSSEPAVTAC